MTDAPRRRTSTAGLTLVVAGIVLAVVLFWQPWAACEGEDSSAGCPVPTEAIGWTYAGWAVAVAAVVAGTILTALAGRPLRGRPASP